MKAMRSTPATPTSEAAIWQRVIQPEDDDLSAAAARAFLRLRFQSHDLERMHALAVKNQQETLTEQEIADLDAYRRVGLLLELLQAKARLILKKRGVDAARHG
jgi:hypothetical protein